jgi:pimeloyl-ACP methyl ester carboxylesterase
MAGRPVFSTAARSPALFGAMAAGQALAARLASMKLAAVLFASAQGEDRTLAQDPAFHAGMAAILSEGLGHGRANYVREIGAYVSDWSAILPAIRHPVTLWQGEEDNWSPPAMADALAERLPNVIALHRLPGLSHYSTLRAWLDA